MLIAITERQNQHCPLHVTVWLRIMLFRVSNKGLYVKTKSAHKSCEKVFTFIGWDRFVNMEHSGDDVKAIKRINQLNCNICLPPSSLQMKVDYPARVCFPKIGFEKPVNDINILEIGCGWGRSTQFYAKSCKQVVSIDFSASSIVFNQNHTGRTNNVEYIVGDLIDCINERIEFDCVALVHILSFLPPSEALRLLKRIDELARPKAHILLSDFSILNWHLRVYATSFWNMRRRCMKEGSQGLGLQYFLDKYRRNFCYWMVYRRKPVINGKQIGNYSEALKCFDDTVAKVRDILCEYQGKDKLHLPLTFYGEGYKPNILFYWRIPLFPWEIDFYLEQLEGSWRVNFLEGYTHRTTYGQTIEVESPVNSSECFVVDLEKVG